MTALAGPRATPSREYTMLLLPVAAGVTLYAGALAAIDSNGYVTKGAADPALHGIGKAIDTVDNSSGIAGAVSASVQLGIFRFDNATSTDEITFADIGHMAYIVDDQTVAKTSNGGARGRAGFIADVDDNGVWIVLGQAGALLAASKAYLTLTAADLVGANAKIYGVTAPVAGTVSKIYTSLEGHALATGDVTLTGKIGSVAITGGVVTIAQAGSAIGDQDSAAPTAARTVAVGDRINFTVGGTNDNAAASAQIVVEITY